MNNLHTLISDELLTYHYNLSPDTESDLDLISMDTIDNLPYISSSVRLLLDYYPFNIIYNNANNNGDNNSSNNTKKIIYPKFEKWGKNGIGIERANVECPGLFGTFTYDPTMAEIRSNRKNIGLTSYYEGGRNSQRGKFPTN